MDFLTDQNPKAFYKAAAAQLFPEFAEENWTQPEEVQDLPGAAFADPAAREFPVHTKVATVLSAIYLAGMPLYAAGADTDVRAVTERIKRAAQVHEISEHVDAAFAHFSSFARKAASETAQDQFALVAPVGSFYPLRTKGDVVDSGRGIDEDFGAKRLPIKQARQAALATVKRAHELGVQAHELPDELKALGADNFPDVDALRKQASWRAKLTGDTAYEEAAEHLCADSSEAVKQACAEIWQELDNIHNVDLTPLTPPVHRVMFSGVPREKFEKVANSYVWFGEDMIPCPVVAALTEEAVKRAYSTSESARVLPVVKAAFDLEGEKASAILAEWDPQEVARLARNILAQHVA